LGGLSFYGYLEDNYIHLTVQLALFLGLLRLQFVSFLITCSMQNWREKATSFKLST